MQHGLSELLLLGVVMTVGFVAGSLVERVGLPRVTAYVAVGALFAEPVLGGWVPGSPGVWVDQLTNTALGVIAFLVGAEIDPRRLKEERREVAGVVLGQSLGALLLITAALGGLTALASGLFGRPIDWSTALVFAAIGTATAPAGTVAVIDEYDARGPLSAILLGIVAVDDAISVVAFTVAEGLAGGEALSQQLLGAGREILLAVIAGLVLGAALGWFSRRVHEGDLRLPLILAAIFLNLGLADRFGYSDLLSNIVLGLTAMLSFHRSQREWLEPMDHVREAIFLIFFTLAGTHFDPAVFAGALPLILLYIVARFAGKLAGSSAGAAMVGADPKVRRWAGLALMPQAGVAVGLALRATTAPGLTEVGPVLLNTVIGSTIVFALAAPWLTKLALRRAGEIDGG